MARYADKLLAQGERIALRGRQHFLATLIEGRVAWAIFIAALVLLILVAQLGPATPDLRPAAVQLARARPPAHRPGLAGPIYLNWYMQDYLVTNRRVVKVEGVLKKRSADSSLEKINDAVLEQSVFGRMFGYGDLDILTANEQSVDRYRMLAQAQTFKRTMLEEKHRLEQDVFQIPAPPLRAAPAARGRAGSAAPARRRRPPPQPARDELGRDHGALGDLADLRDRGAISPEEYEAKKQDLLGRL